MFSARCDQWGTMEVAELLLCFLNAATTVNKILSRLELKVSILYIKNAHCKAKNVEGNSGKKNKPVREMIATDKKIKLP